jgi:pimeloyl-ACP methyl ester carboxylesterase
MFAVQSAGYRVTQGYNLPRAIYDYSYLNLGTFMRLLFKGELFDSQLLRALSHTYYGGADIGECMSTAQRIKELDALSWYSNWVETADRVYQSALTSLAAGRVVSAREAFFRASNYYRASYAFLIGRPTDARVAQAFDKHVEAFQRATALFSSPVERIAIPYADTTLPGYFFRVDDSGRPRPTLILTGGYDSTAEELYFFSAAAALRRGYNCICFDGPGQGAALIKQGLVFRPDWEVVITAALDYALAQTGVDTKRVALMGLSFGGYLAPRAVSHEHRLAACIADPGEYDLFTAVKDRMPGFMAQQVPNGNPLLLGVLKNILNRNMHHVSNGWGLRRGMWTHGADTPYDYILLMQDYTLQGHAEHIQCPTLVCHADHDDVAMYARQLFDKLTCPKTFISFTSVEGAGEHCESGNRSLFHQRAYDWLDTTLGAAA